MSTSDNPTNIIDPSIVSPRSVAIKWGLIGAAAHIIIDLLGYITGMIKPGDVIYSIAIFAIAIFAIVMAIREHKAELAGYIRGGRCVTVGLISGLAYGIIAGLWGIVFYNFLVPDFYEEMNNAMVVMYEDMGQSDEQIEAIMSYTKMSQTPIGGLVSSLIGGIFSGVFLSIIPALILKKKPKGIY